jgi:hypothetical protein
MMVQPSPLAVTATVHPKRMKALKDPSGDGSGTEHTHETCTHSLLMNASKKS